MLPALRLLLRLVVALAGILAGWTVFGLVGGLVGTGIGELVHVGWPATALGAGAGLLGAMAGGASGWMILAGAGRTNGSEPG
jgi:hypothetical protein